MATTSGFVQQPTTSFNPGFVQANPPAEEQTQTFGISSAPATQTFGIANVPTGPSFGSFAPFGQGQPATSTVPSISAVSGGGDSGLGTAAVAGGGVALAALLSKLGGGKEKKAIKDCPLIIFLLERKNYLI